MFQLSPLLKIRSILQKSTSVAVVGLSPKPERPSNEVARYLIGQGYTVIPVNPGHQEILGRTCFPDLLSIPGQVDIVDIFRKSEHVLPIVRDAIEKKAGAIWMQEGVVNEEAAELAEKHGITVIMNRCIKIDHQQLGQAPD